MKTTQSLLKERILFDPLANARANRTILPVIQIPADFWNGNQPILQRVPNDPDASLPNADVLVLAWTTAETQGLSAVFTSSRDYQISWNKYAHLSKTYINQVPGDIVNSDSALKNGYVGYYTLLKFSNKTVLLFKSQLHPAVDGDGLPVLALLKQVITEVSPKLVITTGTAGASGSYLQPGDAVITNKARFKLVKPVDYPDFPAISNENPPYSNDVQFDMNFINQCNASATGFVLPTLRAIAARNGYPPILRIPQIFYNDIPETDIKVIYDAVSSNGFTMDDTTHVMELQLLGIYNEMNDAFVAYVINELTSSQPQWLSIRNISEPQAPNLTASTRATWHGMYLNYSLYTTYNSAFACWSVICGLT